MPSVSIRSFSYVLHPKNKFMYRGNSFCKFLYYNAPEIQVHVCPVQIYHIFILPTKFINRVCLGLSLLSNSLWLSRMISSYLNCNSYCNSLLARITKQFNSPDVWFLVATSLATEKISVATQLARITMQI
jgi:hypothetical protein